MRLNAAEWARVESLFPQAAALGGAERARFLDRECAAEPRVRAEIEAMLEADGAGDALLDGPIGLAAGNEKMAELLGAGTRLGSWKIRSLIGHGGMGEVYLAERADGAYAMDAAIKLLKRELFSYANAQRFLRERRVLARLSHPNIARVLDAGTTDDGRPFLVMEFVQGARITDYAHVHQLAPRDAARLMLAVAEAVAEAHRHGVVHRDLKPANVMVNDAQEVKLLDFGIAKLMDEDEAATPGAVAMTPAYAAPEQILGQALTPATDVYALGVMLFQLLTHRFPHRREGMPLPVIAGGLHDETVPRPSDVASDHPGMFGELTHRRQAQALAGDLDSIALKALHADPRRRYATAGDLADDLRRYLQNFPVMARRDSVGYRASRFVRRYPTQVAAAAVAVSALAVGLAAALWQARIARVEADRAERVKEFVLSLFQEQNPAARGQALAVPPAQLVARGLARVDDELAAEPELQARLLSDLGDIQVALGDPAGGRVTLERALVARRAQHGDDSLEVAETLRKLATALGAEGRRHDERARLLDAHAIVDRLGAHHTLEAARIEVRLGYTEDYGKARGAETARHFLNAQHIFEAQLGPDHRDTVTAMFQRGQALEQARLDDDARAVLLEAIARIERSAGPGSAQLILPLAALVRIHKRSGAYDEAERTYRRAVHVQRRHYGPTHPYLSDLLRGWADLEQSRRSFARAEALFDEAFAALPPAAARGRRGELLKDRGQLMLNLARFDQAERDLSEAMAAYREVEGEDSAFTWFVTSEWGRALLGLGRAGEAEWAQRKALERLGAIMGPDAYQNALIADALAETLERRGKLAEAVALRRRALALTEKKYADGHRLVASRQVMLAGSLIDRGAGAEAALLLDRAIPGLRKSATESAVLAEALMLRGRLFADARDLAAARPALEEAVRVYEALPPPVPGLKEARQRLAAAR